MSILQNAYKLSKTVLGSKQKDKVRNVMEEINSFKELKDGDIFDKSERGKSIRNSSAKKAHIQFYGYLLADYRRKEIEKEHSCIVLPLIEEQKALLKSLHEEFLYIDQKVIHLLPNNLAHREVLNPYSEYEAIIKLSNGYTSPLFTEQQLSELVTSFRAHKGFKEIGRIPLDVYNELNKISTEKLIQTIYIFTDSFYKAGVNHYPKDIEEVIIQAKRGNAIIPTRYIFSLMSIKHSIKNLNQLIFQAFFQDRLPIYSEDNIIKISSSSHLAGKGYLIKAQGNESVHPFDLVHLIDPYEENKYPLLCQVEGVSNSYSRDFGMSEDIKLRVLDEDLNPFYGIFDSLR